MKTWLKPTPYLAMLAAALLIPACDDSKPFNDTITVSDSKTGEAPLKVDRIYYCDHTNFTNLEHRHAAECGLPGDCPTLNADGTMTPGAHGAPCPDTSYGGLGIKTQLEAMSQNVTSTANSVKSAVSTQIGAQVGQKVDASGEVSGNLSADAKGSVKAAITRDVQASFERKWSEQAEQAINSKIETMMKQILSIVTTVGGRMGCGQRNDVGLDLTVTITVTFSGSAVISGTVSKDGTVSGLSSNWTAFTLLVNLGLRGPGLVPNRAPTSCVCVPREVPTDTPTGTPTDKTGDDKVKTGDDKNKTVPRFPWKWFPWDFFGSRPLSPADKQFFAAAQVVYVTDREDLTGFTASENVTVLDQKKEPGADAPTELLLAVPGAAGAGYLVYALKAGPDKKGSSASNVASRVQQFKGLNGKDAITYAIENKSGQERDYQFVVKDAGGKTRKVLGHKIASLNGEDIVVSDGKNVAAVERVEGKDRKTGEKAYSEEAKTIQVKLRVEGVVKRGHKPLGQATASVSKAFAEENSFTAYFEAERCTPPVVVVKNFPPNMSFDLSRLDWTATSTGKCEVKFRVEVNRKR